MKIIFYIVGTLLALAAIYFGYFTATTATRVAEAALHPDGGLAAAYGANAFYSELQITLLATIASGVFLAAAAILNAVERAAARIP